MRIAPRSKYVHTLTHALSHTHTHTCCTEMLRALPVLSPSFFFVHALYSPDITHEGVRCTYVRTREHDALKVARVVEKKERRENVGLVVNVMY